MVSERTTLMSSGCLLEATLMTGTQLKSCSSVSQSGESAIRGDPFITFAEGGRYLKANVVSEVE